MIENLQDELYQSENKQAKDAKHGATLLWLIVEGRRGGRVKMQIFGEKPLKFILLLQENDLKTPPYN